MNKKGITPLSVLFVDGVIILIWAFVLAEQLNYWGQKCISDNSLIGIEAFFWANLNGVVLAFFIVGNIGYFYMMS